MIEKSKMPASDLHIAYYSVFQVQKYWCLNCDSVCSVEACVAVCSGSVFVNSQPFLVNYCARHCEKGEYLIII